MSVIAKVKAALVRILAEPEVWTDNRIERGRDKGDVVGFQLGIDPETGLPFGQAEKAAAAYAHDPFPPEEQTADEPPHETADEQGPSQSGE